MTDKHDATGSGISGQSYRLLEHTSIHPRPEFLNKMRDAVHSLGEESLHATGDTKLHSDSSFTVPGVVFIKTSNVPETQEWATNMVIVDGHKGRALTGVPSHYHWKENGSWDLVISEEAPNRLSLCPKDVEHSTGPAPSSEGAGGVMYVPHAISHAKRSIQSIRVDLKGLLTEQYMNSFYDGERWKPYTPPGGLTEWDQAYACSLHYWLSENGDDTQ